MHLTWYLELSWMGWFCWSHIPCVFITLINVGSSCFSSCHSWMLLSVSVLCVLSVLCLVWFVCFVCFLYALCIRMCVVWACDYHGFNDESLNVLAYTRGMVIMPTYNNTWREYEPTRDGNSMVIRNWQTGINYVMSSHHMNPTVLSVSPQIQPQKPTATHTCGKTTRLWDLNLDIAWCVGMIDIPLSVQTFQKSLTEASGHHTNDMTGLMLPQQCCYECHNSVHSCDKSLSLFVRFEGGTWWCTGMCDPHSTVMKSREHKFKPFKKSVRTRRIVTVVGRVKWWAQSWENIGNSIIQNVQWNMYRCYRYGGCFFDMLAVMLLFSFLWPAVTVLTMAMCAYWMLHYTGHVGGFASIQEGFLSICWLSEYRKQPVCLLRLTCGSSLDETCWFVSIQTKGLQPNPVCVRSKSVTVCEGRVGWMDGWLQFCYWWMFVVCSL